MKRIWLLIIVFALTMLGITSYIGTPTTAETESANKTAAANVNIKLFTFKPGSFEVPVGTTVVWMNGDAIEHSVTNGTSENPGGAFDSGFFTKGQTFSFTFTNAGDYPYFCKKHNFMQGTVKVVP